MPPRPKPRKKPTLKRTAHAPRETHPGLRKVERYVAGVLDGSIVVGRLVRLAVERHAKDLAGGRRRGLTFDRQEAAFAIDFCECLRHSKGEWAGQPLVLEPWQAFIVASIFGWKRRDGLRRFRVGLVSVARKNGKSTMAAAIGHKFFVADDEAGAEVFTLATKLSQARLVHDEAKRMVRRSPSLKRLVRVLRDCLYVEATDSKYEPMSSDAERQDGLNVHAAILDEIHAHPDRTLWDVIDTATAARRQPFLLGITTAGSAADREGLYAELKDYSVKVLEGTVQDDTWFAYLAQLDSIEEWPDEAAWPKANPNLGVSVKLDDLRRKAAKAKETPAALNSFLAKHLNMEVEVVHAWLAPGQWDLCKGGAWYAAKGIKPEVLERWRGRPCWIGGDLSSVSDLTAVVAAIPMDDGHVDVLPWAWCPRENAEGRTRDKRVPYLDWARRGLLELTEGNSIDDDAIRARLRWLRDDCGLDVQEIALDPWNARSLATRLAEEDEFTVIEHRQGFISMNSPIKETEKLVLTRKIRHGGNGPLAWCVSNVVTRTDPAGNLKLDKEKSREKIDLAVALVMAVGRALAGSQADSVYQSEGVFSL